MSQHRLTPKPGYERYRIAVGWDRPLGSYFAYVSTLTLPSAPHGRLYWFAVAMSRLPIPLPRRVRALDPEPVMILADSTHPTTEPDVIIQAVAPYAELPDDLICVLTDDRLREGYRHRHRP